MKRVFKVEYNENEDFEVTVGFICKYCRGIFLSSKHRCRYNPRFKGCYSCKNKQGIMEAATENEPDIFIGLDEDEKEFIIGKNIICKKGINPTLDDVRLNGWDYQCTEWESDQ